jgi:hypothetical protein
MQGYQGFQIMIRPEELIVIGLALTGLVIWFVVWRIASSSHPEKR